MGAQFCLVAPLRLFPEINAPQFSPLRHTRGRAAHSGKGETEPNWVELWDAVSWKVPLKIYPAVPEIQTKIVPLAWIVKYIYLYLLSPFLLTSPQPPQNIQL